LHPLSTEAEFSKNEHTLLKIRQAAKRGQVINSSVSLNSHKQHLIQRYGQPDPFPKSTFTYLQFTKRDLAFHFNSRLQIDQITSTDPQLLNISIEQMRKILGKPHFTTESAAGKRYFSYYFGKHELVFVWDNALGKFDQVIVQPKN
jgi:hypothetical protein